MTMLSTCPTSLSQMQTAFLALRHRIVSAATIYFRDIRCGQRRDDYIAEVVALCWKWFRRLAERGKDACRFPSVLARYAARAVRSGRRLCGQLKAKDVLSERAQRKCGFRVEALPVSTRTSHKDLHGSSEGQRRLDCYEERLQDNLQTPVPNQVAFRCDFSAWLDKRSKRDRRLIADMARDERTTELARKYGISPGRVSQLRRWYYDDWQSYSADPAETVELGPTAG